MTGTGSNRARARAGLGTAAFFLVPLTVGGVVPWLLSDWEVERSIAVLAVVGWVLVIGGSAIVLDSFIRFAREGVGTPAPTAPTEQLVVGGLYRHVRNPMYVGVGMAILGQAAILGRPGLVLYAAVFLLGVAGFVAAYEQPTLARRFGTSYADYCAAVPAWIPRLRPWAGEPATTESANAAFVRRAYELVNAGNLDALVNGFEPGFEWHPDELAPGQATRRTAGDIKLAVDDFTSTFADFRTEVEELIEQGDQVIAVVRHVGRVGGGDVERRETHLWTFADGRPRSLREFEERDAALAAARLSG